MLRHNFDFMHIGKNMSESLLNTFMGTDGKSKDNLNSRLDLQSRGIRIDLHLVDVDDQMYLQNNFFSFELIEYGVAGKYIWSSTSTG